MSDLVKTEDEAKGRVAKIVDALAAVLPDPEDLEAALRAVHGSMDEVDEFDDDEEEEHFKLVMEAIEDAVLGIAGRA